MYQCYDFFFPLSFWWVGLYLILLRVMMWQETLIHILTLKNIACHATDLTLRFIFTQEIISWPKNSTSIPKKRRRFIRHQKKKKTRKMTKEKRKNIFHPSTWNMELNSTHISLHVINIIGPTSPEILCLKKDKLCDFFFVLVFSQ